MPPPPVKLNRSRQGFNSALRRWHAHPSVLVEGDSWFQYDAYIPANPSSSNLFLGTAQYFTCVGLLVAQVGDTIKDMLGPHVAFAKPGYPVEVSAKGDKNLRRIRGHLHRQEPLDLLFFSGGGNDIVDHLHELIRRHEAGITAQQALVPAKVAALMSAIQQGYLRLIATRDAVSPKTWIITHQYGVPNLLKGPFRRVGINWTSEWIKPQFLKQGYLARGQRSTPAQLELMTGIIRLLLAQFSSVLAQIQQLPGTRNFYVGATSGVLTPEHWRDEMHLTKDGFRVAAQEFRPHLKQLFPSWTA